jgi:site-specific DNA recombinase
MPTSKQPLRCVIYARVSSEDQAGPDKISLSDQLASCRRKIEEMGAIFVSYYEDDVSGVYYETREGIQNALSDIESGRADTLVVARSDRLGRDLEHKLNIKRRLRLANARVLFCDFNFTDNATGRAASNIKDVFDEMYRDYLREITDIGRRGKAQRGIQPIRGRRPFGYHLVVKDHHTRGEFLEYPLGTYIIKEDEAEVVREIYQRYLNGQTLGKIAQWLFNSGVETSRGTVLWDRPTVQRILTHTRYKGQAVFGCKETILDESRLLRGFRSRKTYRIRPQEEWTFLPAPAIVSEEVWQAVQDEMEWRRKQLAGNPHKAKLLTGLLRCPKCGYSMIARTQRRRRTGKPNANGVCKEAGIVETLYYCCKFARAANSITKRTCTSKHHHGENLEKRVLEIVENMASKPELLRAVLEQQRQKPSSKPAMDEAKLLAELAKIEKQEYATAKSMTNASLKEISTEPFERILQDLAVQKRRVREMLNLASEEKKHNRDVTNEVMQIAKMLDHMKTSLYDSRIPTRDRRDLLSLVIDRIEPHENGTLSIHFKSQG